VTQAPSGGHRRAALFLSDIRKSTIDNGSLSPHLKSVMAGFAEQLACEFHGDGEVQHLSRSLHRRRQRGIWIAVAVSIMAVLMFRSAGHVSWPVQGLSASVGRVGHPDRNAAPSNTALTSGSENLWFPGSMNAETGAAGSWPDAEVKRGNVMIVTLDTEHSSTMIDSASLLQLSDVTMILRRPELPDRESEGTHETGIGNPVLIDAVDGRIELRGCRIRSAVPVTLIRAVGATQISLIDCQIDLPAGVLLHGTGGRVSLTLQNSRLRTATLIDIDQDMTFTTTEELQSAELPVTDVVVEQSVLQWKTSLVNLEGLPACLKRASGVSPGPRLEWIQNTLNWSGRTGTYLPEYGIEGQAGTDRVDPVSESQAVPTAAAWLTVRGRVPVNLEVGTRTDWLTLLDVRGTHEL